MHPKVTESMEILLSFLTTTRTDKTVPHANAIFVFWSAQDMRITEKTLVLWKKGKAGIIIVSGRGTYNNVPPKYKSGAEHFAAKLQKGGIPEDCILLDEIATKTIESVHRSVIVALQNGIPAYSAIVCAKPYHLRRIFAYFAHSYPRMKIYESAFPLKKEEWEKRERMKRIINEISRIEQYPYIYVPFSVKKACDVVYSYLLYTPNEKLPEL